MATPIADLVVRFRGDKRHYDRTVRDVERGNDRIRRSFATLQKVAVGAFVAGGAAAVAATKAFSNFDSAMTQSLAIMGDVTDTMRQDMVDAARQVSRTTTTSSTEAARSFFFLASAGLDAEQSIAALPQVAAFAQAGMFDMAQATDLATDAQSALGLTVQDAVANLANLQRVTDTLVRANQLANATVEQFSTALTTEAGAAMKTFGIDVEEGVAVLAAFADQGIKGQTAGSGFSRVLRLMSQAAISNREEMAALGLEFFDAQGELRNMADIVEDLTNVLGPMSDAQRTAALESIGFTARVQGIIQPLLGTADAIREYESGLRDAAGTTQEVANNQLKGFGAQMQLVRNRVVNVAQDIGRILAPVVVQAANKIGDLADSVAVWARENRAQVQGMIEGFVQGLGHMGSKTQEFIAHIQQLPIFNGTTAVGGLIGYVFLGPLGLAAGVTIGSIIDGLMTKLGKAAGGGALTVFEALTQQQERLLNYRRQLETMKGRGAEVLSGGQPIEDAIANVDKQLAVVAMSIRRTQEGFNAGESAAKGFWDSLKGFTMGPLPNLDPAGGSGGGDTGGAGADLATTLDALPEPVIRMADSFGVASIAIDHGIDRVREMRANVLDLRDTGVDMARAFAGSLASSLRDGRDAFRSFADYAIQQLARIAAQFAVFQLLNVLLPGSGFVAKLGKSFGFLADGGPAQRNQPYIVGERGPELFVPDQSGQVVPNGGPVSISLDVSGMPPATNSLAMARDKDWLAFLHASNRELQASGG